MVDKFYNITTSVLPVPDAKLVRLGATEYLGFGSDNRYPNHLFDLFNNVAVLRSLVEGSALLSAGLFSSDVVKVDWYELFEKVYLYGWCPVLVRQSFDRTLVHLTVLDPRYVRMTEDGSKFAYSEQEGWRKKVEYDLYPCVGSGIFVVRLNSLMYPYSLPVWSSALKEVSILDQVANYHHNSLQNGFSGSFIINMNNGMPSPTDKAEIERMVNDKFCGTDNAGRVLISFNDSKDNEASLSSLPTEDTSSRYQDLIKSCNQSLFTSFRACPQLFGVPDNISGVKFADANEYKMQFALYLRFFLKPIVDRIYSQVSTWGVQCKDVFSLYDDIDIRTDAGVSSEVNTEVKEGKYE